MTTLKVVLSTVADGSMYNRHDDTDTSVIENRRIFLEKNEFAFERTSRVDTKLLERATKTHDTNFCRYIEIPSTAHGDGIKGPATILSDALVTTEVGVPIMLPVADCIGAILFDPENHVLMVSHLGRHSLEQDGALKSVEHLTSSYGSDVKHIQVWLSPAPGKESYQIWALNNAGMKEAAFEQLLRAGITQEAITDDPRDTAVDTDFYSYSEFLKGNRKEDGDHMIAAVMQ